MEILVFIFGAVIGSFLNVCIYRLPLGLSIVRPRSYCPKCKRQILWSNNIPIVSYLVLGGRCRDCRTRIPVRYFIVEVLTALLLAGLYLSFGFTAKFFAYSILTCGLIAVSFIDLATYGIPDVISIGGIIAGLAFSLAYPSVFDAEGRLLSFSRSFIGAVAGSLSIYMMGLLGAAAFKKEAMGEGDIILMGAIGAFLGWKLTILAFFIAPFFGALFGLVVKAKTSQSVIPYGPFLALGAVIAIFFGENVIQFLFYGLY
ncbi:MAG: prepilin peptidase [Candidatus Omnitrophica bacterium]|nr:prepilin peptidase [Candidatus Omnitrophota bacterium]